MTEPDLLPLNDRSLNDRELKLGVRLSLIGHVILAALIIGKAIVFPTDPLLIPPALRVDIVGLPDLLKSEKNQIPAAQLDALIKKAQTQPKKVKEEVEPTRTDEMVKADRRKKKPEKSKTVAKEEKDEKTREERMTSALERIQALAKITDDGSNTGRGAVIKGNRISKGTSFADDAVESDHASYYDTLRSHLQENWALPVWLTRQQLSAQVQLFIDPQGRMIGFRFIKVSGNAQFDEQVKKTLQDSQPFPAPPDNVLGTIASQGIRVGFPL